MPEPFMKRLLTRPAVTCLTRLVIWKSAGFVIRFKKQPENITVRFSSTHFYWIPDQLLFPF